MYIYIYVYIYIYTYVCIYIYVYIYDMRWKGMKQTQPSIDDRRNMVAGACLRKLCKAQPPSVAGLLGFTAARPAGESP